jgi:hypothetical protein
MGFRALSEAVLGPTRRDQEPIDTRFWGDALVAWEDLARDFAATRPWLAVPKFEGVRASLAMVGPDLAARLAPADLWSLVHAPVDALQYPVQIVARMAAILAGEDRSLDSFLVMPGRKSSLESLEGYSEVLTVLRWFVTRWPGRGGIDAAGVSRVEAACHRLFAKASASEIAHNAYGLCEDCGAACMPWFYKCESCFAESRLYRRAGFSSFGDYGYDDDEDFG